MYYTFLDIYKRKKINKINLINYFFYNSREAEERERVNFVERERERERFYSPKQKDRTDLPGKQGFKWAIYVLALR